MWVSNQNHQYCYLIMALALIYILTNGSVYISAKALILEKMIKGMAEVHEYGADKRG